MIAAITSYYNPSKRPTKIANFNRFRNSINGIELFVVEAAFGDDPFTLPSDECHLQLRCKDVIWQQYRLINVGVQKLPDRFDKVVWIDCDILFDEPFWHKQLSDMLDQFKVVQSYGEVMLLEKGHDDKGVVQVGVAKQAIKNSKKSTAKLMSGNLDMSAKFASGFSWGTQREVIEKYGVYDYWITGSSDSAFVIGIWGDWKNQFLTERLNVAMKNHYLEWALPFNSYIDGKVSYLDTRIRHMWHGSRNYKKRWKCLKDFDPYVDIGIADNGVLCWTSDKPELHRGCRNMCLNYDIEFQPFL